MTTSGRAMQPHEDTIENWNGFSNSADPISTAASDEDDTLSIHTVLTDVTEKPRLPTITRKFILDIPICIVYFAINLSSTVLQNQLLYQSCVIVYSYSAEQCQPLLGIVKADENTTVIENEVQPYVARILMARSLIESLLPAFLSLLIGPWSDRFGRRPILLVSFGGLALSYTMSFIIALISMYTPVSPLVYIFSSIPFAITGRTCVLMTIVYAYISDVAAENFIAQRMFLNDAALGLGTIAGSLVSSNIFAVTNMATIFGISALAMLLALLYGLIFSSESLNVRKCSFMEKVRGFFQYSLLKELFRTSFKRREDLNHIFIWLTISSLVLTAFVSGGESNVFYLFVRKQFNWTIMDYTSYTSIGTGIQVVSGVAGIIILRKYLNFSIVAILLISLACYLLQSIVRAVAMYWWEMYLAAAVGFMSGLANPMLLATISKLVVATEIGKIYALTNALTTISPLISSPIYTSVYNATLEFYPGLFNIISASIYLLSFVLIGIIYFKRRSRALTAI